MSFEIFSFLESSAQYVFSLVASLLLWLSFSGESGVVFFLQLWIFSRVFVFATLPLILLDYLSVDIDVKHKICVYIYMYIYNIRMADLLFH